MTVSLVRDVCTPSYSLSSPLHRTQHNFDVNIYHAADQNILIWLQYTKLTYKQSTAQHCTAQLVQDMLGAICHASNLTTEAQLCTIIVRFYRVPCTLEDIAAFAISTAQALATSFAR